MLATWITYDRTLLQKFHCFVITRWNVWFEAAFYHHAEHLDLYISIVNAETENGSTRQLRQLLTLLHGNQLNELREQLEFLVVHCERLIKTLKSREAKKEFKATDIHNSMSDLLSWLHNPGFPYSTESCKAPWRTPPSKLADLCRWREVWESNKE